LASSLCQAASPFQALVVKPARKIALTAFVPGKIFLEKLERKFGILTLLIKFVLLIIENGYY
jgi:hypothetical protein